MARHPATGAAWRAAALVAASAAASFLLFASAAFAQDAAIPPLTARVTDSAGMLTPEQRSALEAVLADYEQQKGTQIAVLTVPSTAPEVIDQYGIRVAEAWKIGRKGTADGVILIVAKDNPRDLRRLRIEVGKGVEGAIPDSLAKRIINEDIAPHFRENDYYGGMVAGVSRIKSLLEGEALPPPPEREVKRANGSSGFGIGLPLLFFLFVIVSGVFRAMGRRRVGYMSGNRALNRSIAPVVLGGLLGALASRSGGGGFGGGGFGGGGGGGGFSGGGGDFGGGGASGDW